MRKRAMSRRSCRAAGACRSGGGREPACHVTRRRRSESAYPQAGSPSGKRAYEQPAAGSVAGPVPGRTPESWTSWPLPQTTGASMVAMTSVGQVVVVETPSGPVVVRSKDAWRRRPAPGRCGGWPPAGTGRCARGRPGHDPPGHGAGLGHGRRAARASLRPGTGQVVADQGVAALVAAGAQLPVQGDGVGAAGVPPFPQVGLVPVQDAGAAAGAVTDQELVGAGGARETGGRC
jgi:hypothetical protein